MIHDVARLSANTEVIFTLQEQIATERWATLYHQHEQRCAQYDLSQIAAST
jgi:hypothetical protein